MSENFAKAELLGHVGNDPDIVTRKRQDGQDFTTATFQVAVNAGYKKGNTWVDVLNWHRVIVKPPALVEKVQKKIKKGAFVFIAGNLQNRTYQHQEKGDTLITEIIVDWGGSIYVLDRTTQKEKITCVDVDSPEGTGE